MSFHEDLATIHAVRRIDDREGRARLEEAIAAGDPRLAEAAAQALGRIGGPEALSKLTLLLASEDPHRAVGAIRGLIALGDVGAAESLHALASDERPYRPWGESPEGGHHQTVGRFAAAAVTELTGAR